MTTTTTNSVAYFDVSFVNSYIGWDIMAYTAEGDIIDDLGGRHLPEYHYLKRDAVRWAKELASSVGVTDIRVGLRKDGGWYPEGMKA
tara:strand:- start:559 stop:819 length:261 start_codon:yes stop_codon:yes gene_type:complete